MTSSKTAFQGRKFDFEKVSKITSKCLRMLPNDVSDVPKWLGTLTWSYIDPRSILKKSKKIIFFEFFSSFEADFVKEFLIKWVVDGKKIIFFKNQSFKSKIRLLEASRIGLKLSDPRGIDHNLKIEKAFRFWNSLANGLFQSHSECILIHHV